jgi:crossover junction endodeoxyribonuclease RusA
VAKQSWRGRDLMRGRLAVTLRFFRRNRTVCDIDNLCKSILDGLQGVVFKDDNQIDLLHAERDIDKEDPRVEVLIEQL